MRSLAKDDVAEDATDSEISDQREARETASRSPTEAMARYQAGDYGAFEEIYSDLAPRLRVYFVRRPLSFGATADDLVQETFLQIHRARRTFRPDLPFEPWGYAIARHAYLMDCRRRSRRRTGPGRLADAAAVGKQASGSAVVEDDSDDRSARRPGRRGPGGERWAG